tara:strand:+ start:487 stop:756 length:270 start_codon:yes stop_codon:yes gene_type:complete
LPNLPHAISRFAISRAAWIRDFVVRVSKGTSLVASHGFKIPTKQAQMKWVSSPILAVSVSRTSARATFAVKRFDLALFLVRHTTNNDFF